MENGQNKKNMNGSKKRPTLAQVAKLAGVSTPTVSLVMNGKENCWASRETRARIFKAAETLGYRPNLAARALREGRTSSVGLLTVSLALGNDNSKIYGFYEAAAESGYNLMVAFNPNDPSLEDESIRHFLDRGIDALAVYPTECGDHKELRLLVDEGFPVVTFDGRHILDFDCDDVAVDFRGLAEKQLEYLMENGRKRVLVANTIPSALVNSIRDASFKELSMSAGLQQCRFMDVEWRSSVESPDPEEVFEGISAYVKRNKGAFDAVVGCDSIASLVIRALLRENIKVPEDVLVVGGGNSNISSYGVLPFPSVDTRDHWLGERAFKLLLDRIDGKTTNDGFRRIMSESNMVVR